MDNYLRWNIANWITVVLMVTVAYVLFGAACAFIKSKKEGG